MSNKRKTVYTGINLSQNFAKYHCNQKQPLGPLPTFKMELD